ncbi:MAG TPA: S8 family serine peptidase, partial [Dehalococcoidia bacterium]
MIVKLIPGLSTVDQEAVILRNGGTQTSTVPALQLHTVEVSPDSISQVTQSYQSDPQVAAVEREKSRGAGATPSDPAYPEQWGLAKIGWDSAYGAVSPGGSATVAVLDTGVDASQPDLAGRVTAGYSVFAGSSAASDPNGHGTWLASIAAAGTDNGLGIAGVDYAGVSIMPVQVLDSNGLGNDSDIIMGVVWAADHGANVILMGFSNPGYSQNLQDAIDYAWSKGAVLVAATGNDGSSSPTYPAGDAEVMGVSATDSSDSLWSGSNYGADTFIAAPGVSIAADAVGGGTTSITGTSASAAFVAGAAALLVANDPSASNGVVVGRLARNADAAGTQDQTGNGRLNLARAISDTATDPVVPAGAPGGGPVVAPYRAAGTASSGQGTMTVAPLSVTVGSTTTLTFTFTAPSGKDFNAGSQTEIDIAAGWSWSTGSVSVTHVTCSAATLASATSTAITVNMTCAGGTTYTVSVSATAPTTAATGSCSAPIAGCFTTKTKQNGGTLAPIGTSPTVTVHNSATFTVNKDFSDKPSTDTTTVIVTLNCGAGTIVGPNPKNASEASPAVFTVNGLASSTTCTASESPVPGGYTSSGCTAAVTLTVNGASACTITNTLNSASFTVSKVYSPAGNTTAVTVTLTCTTGSVSPASASAAPGSPASFTVTGYTAGATCTATESGVPAGYTSSSCNAAIAGAPSGTGSCTITNTRTDTFTVN